jgi:hypothetical protein
VSRLECHPHSSWKRGERHFKRLEVDAKVCGQLHQYRAQFAAQVYGSTDQAFDWFARLTQASDMAQITAGLYAEDKILGCALPPSFEGGWFG